MPISRRPRKRWLILGALPLLGLLALAIAVWGVDYPVQRLAPGRDGPLVLLARDGQVLQRFPARDGRRHVWTPLADLPAQAVMAILEAEDRHFFDHHGVDFSALLRAAWLDLRSGRAAFGGSTLTMQLVRAVDHPAQPRTLANKLVEMVLALRLERAMTKHQILEQYLNRAYFGRGAYGLEGAAQTWFGKRAQALSPAQVQLLAVLLRAPARYDLERHLPRAVQRRHHVLDLLVQRDKLTADEQAQIEREPVHPHREPDPRFVPQFCTWLVGQLPAQVRERGGTVHTTLDLGLQRRMESQVRDHVQELAGQGVGQAGALVLDSQTGEVVSLVGSVDPRVAELDIATWRRHPGSALKPFLYALALEQGAHPASLALDIHDVPSDYHVRHLTQPERGPVRLRAALAGSMNLAAVHTLEQLGIPRFLQRLEAAGLGPLTGTADDYGLRLALGAARVRLLDLAAAYGFLVRQGRTVAAHGTLRVTAGDGQVWTPPPPREGPLFPAEVAWQIQDMLADGDARAAIFGSDLPLDLPFPVAAKTGTSRGFSDTVALGVTNEWTVAAWAGNFDGTSIHGVLAMRAAAPLVRAGLLLAGHGKRLTLPTRPATLHPVEVCALSGMLPGPDCPHRRSEAMTVAQRPTQTCTWHGHDAAGGQTLHWPRLVLPWARRHRPGTLELPEPTEVR